MIASHFQTTDGKTVDLQDFISSQDLIGGEEDQGPVLKLWAGSHYDDYYYLAEDMDGNLNVWSGDGYFKAEDVAVDLGAGAFFKAKNDCSITVAGQVAEADQLNVPLKAGSFNLVANPFPVPFEINSGKADFASCLIGGEEDQGPNLKIWAGSHYDDYYFLAEDMDGNLNVWSGDGYFKADETIVSPGHGFWLKYTNNPEDVTLNFTK